MKKNILYGCLIVAFISAVGFVVARYNDKQATESNKEYVLLPRKSGSSKDAEWLFSKKNVDNLLAKLRQNPADTKSRIALANAYIAESRISGNSGYYDMAAMSCVNKILKANPSDFEALTLKALLYLSQHHFAEALTTAQSAQKINPENAFVYGLLIDANVEMGNYQQAVEAADKMVSIRPDLRSYSRIAYLREIHGDYPGAIEAMQRAVAAGADGQEPTEWCRVQLGKLYEATGDTKDARFQYDISLAARPGYPYALAGIGRLKNAEHQYDSAVYFYSEANALISDYAIRENLAMLYRVKGDKVQSDSIYKSLLDDMTANAVKENNDASIGHYADREMAYVYLHTGDVAKAEEHGLAEYNRRPKNIDVNETMAWIYYNKGQYQRAMPFLNAAFTTESNSPTLQCIAGLIYLKSGDTSKGEEYIRAGLNNNPVVAEDVKSQCLQTIVKK